VQEFWSVVLELCKWSWTRRGPEGPHFDVGLCRSTNELLALPTLGNLIRSGHRGPTKDGSMEVFIRNKAILVQRQERILPRDVHVSWIKLLF